MKSITPPDVYRPDYYLKIKHTAPVRPDSFYATSKVFGETLGRQYVDTQAWPKQFFALRIGSLRSQEHDHPFADAECAVHGDRIARGSDEYLRLVKRMKALWISRRDLANLVDCCLSSDRPSFDIFFGISDNS